MRVDLVVSESDSGHLATFRGVTRKGKTWLRFAHGAASDTAYCDLYQVQGRVAMALKNGLTVENAKTGEIHNRKAQRVAARLAQ